MTPGIILFLALASGAEAPHLSDCERMWLVRVLYQEPVFTPTHSWRWLYVETAPVVEWADADARRRQIEAEGYTYYADPACPGAPHPCSQEMSDTHVTAASIAFASVKQVCCRFQPPGPQVMDCDYVDTLPPPFPLTKPSAAL